MARILSSFRKNELLRILVGLVFFVPGAVLALLEIAVLPTILCIFAMIIAGFPVFIDAARGIIRRDFLDEKFLMSIAAIGATVIGEVTEGAAVMLFFLVGEYFEHRATRAARASIKSLMEIRPDTAIMLVDGEECEVDSEDVPVGSVILIRPGDRVPIDSVMVSGRAEVDTSAITGESLPRPVSVGDALDSGSVLLGASVTARTVRSCDQSRASRILALVEEATDRKSREESFITSFSRYYTPAVIFLSLLMAVLPPIFGWTTLPDAIYRALSFLVVSCPCALVISVPMAFFGGIGGAAKRGVLYKGGNIFSAVAYPERIVFDKTGTLTTGELRLVSVNPVGIGSGELLSYASAAERDSTHPIARGILAACKSPLRGEELRELAGLGIISTVEGVEVSVGNAALMERVSPDFTPTTGEGIVYVAIGGVYRGYLSFSDSIKPEAVKALLELRRLGVKKTYVLSGDRRESAVAVGEALSIDEVYSELLPEEKYRRLEEIIADSRGSTVYVGDGINDAPSLARADVGIAMGERGSDSAIEASDVVIMSDVLTRIPTAVRYARRTVRIAKENIVFALSVKLLALVLVGLGVAGMWMAVVADVGVAVLAILNSMRTIFAPLR